MYTKIINVQILVSLLKQHNIKHLVLSAGTRHVPLALSVENDPFFKSYSVVDERSAAYFAIGLSKELNEPVAIACTSSTATCNYTPAIAEAYYQNVPLLVLTGDRDPYRLDQLEDQMINQIDMYKNFCKKCVQLPIVRSEYDAWYCQRLINEAILELTRNGNGPVQINFPINQTIQEIADSSAKELPKYNKIERIEWETPIEKWEKVKDSLLQKKRILIVCGSNPPATADLTQAITDFFLRYNCVFATESLSNLKCEGTLDTYLLAESISTSVLKEIRPELIIFFGGNYVSKLKILIRNINKTCESWYVAPNGKVIDQYQNLTTVFECSPEYFFSKLSNLADNEKKNDKLFFEELNLLNLKIRDKAKSFALSTTTLSAFAAMKYLAERIPEHSLLHLSILNSTRIMQLFPLADDVTVYSNIGTDGIDGSMSTFLGQAMISSREAYLVIGDLSFFYDMNSIGIREISSNVHILLVNNGGGSEFYLSMGPENLPNIDMNISASHHKRAKAWVIANGIRYLSATSVPEYIEKLEEFVKHKGSPILLEIFTDKLNDVNVFKSFRKAIHYDTERHALITSIAANVEKVPGLKKAMDSSVGKKIQTRIKNFKKIRS